MKSGRGGERPGAGRPATGRKERITIQPTGENLEWLRRQKGSYSDAINRLINRERGACEKCGRPMHRFHDCLLNPVANPPVCEKCGGRMSPGKAIQQTYTGVADFIGGEVVTISAGGPGKLIDCMKCRSCGHSVTI